MDLNRELMNAVYYNEPLEKIKELVEKGADIHFTNEFHLRWAIDNHRLDVTEYLVEKGANIYVDDGNILRRATLRRSLPIVKYLIENGAYKLNVKNGALILAADNNFIEITKYLIEKGSYPTQDMHLDENVQEKAILNNPSCITFILNLTDSLKKKYSAYIELTDLGL